MSNVMLIDGNSLTYRAFFALPTDMATSSGQVTNAVYGFASMLINLVRDHKPDRIIVAFDRKEPTFRHKRLPSYKANREASPDILRQQMGLVRQLVDVLDLPVAELAGFEADDIIATYATAAATAGDDVIVVTGDRDSYQLVRDPHIRVLYNKRGVSDYALYDEAGIFERTGVRPDQYVMYAAMRGDPSDNLPGVPGVGEKTAAKLIGTYGDLDGIFANLSELTPKLRERLGENEPNARLNVELMTLVHDVPVEAPYDSFEFPKPDPVAVGEFFSFLEMNSLVARLQEAFGETLADVDTGPERAVVEAELVECDTIAAAKPLLAGLADPLLGPVAVELVGGPGIGRFEGIAIVSDPEMAEVLWIPADWCGALEDSLGAVFGGRSVAAHDAKPLLRQLLSLDMDVPRVGMDTKIAAYLIDPAMTQYRVSELLARYADAELAEDSAVADGQLDFGDSSVSAAQAAARTALAVQRLCEPLAAALEDRGLTSLFNDVELPLIRVLARMEDEGVGVDRAELQALNTRFDTEAEQLRGEIVELAGEPFNVNSTPQLRHVLFDKLGLTPQKKTKTGFSTDAATLERLRGDHPIVEALLRYREVEKLRSTYGEGLLAAVAPDERIHATFNQTVARTGRLSSDAPNLHNIPVRSSEGRLFRRAFIPAPNAKLLIADYNQIELRCIAHLAQDPGLIEAFTTGADVHNQVASRTFGVPMDDVTYEMRSKAKMVGYGLAYGMEAFGLGQRLGIPTGEAQSILDAYFRAFPAVHDYMDRTVAEARERGYTETLFGRRRQIPELSSTVRSVRLAGERQAMNAGIQGLAADIFKVALVRLDAALDSAGLDSRIVLQVHDEIIVESPIAEVEPASALVVDVMTHAFTMTVPLEVNMGVGDSWADAKS